MINSWDNKHIEAILRQLDALHLPFSQYTFAGIEQGSLKLIGRGGYSNVYEAVDRKKRRKKYALKVIGFSDKHVDSKSFREVVKTQLNLSIGGSTNIVKVFDYVEVRVWINGDNEVIKAERVNFLEDWEDIDNTGDYLDLQFIVMEKLKAVITHNYAGKTILYPDDLANGSEEEILNLAHDIGNAIYSAHTMRMLHRDIKLENIFYDPKTKKYKLGDFGIAKLTNDGMANTVAFTRGYGAPEAMGVFEDGYDYTADIYSFGMVLYVLLNDLRFPDSEKYNVNVAQQYSSGYVLPLPLKGSEEICRIVLKACSFDSFDRYQSMEEVLINLNKIRYGYSVKYYKEHNKSSLILGIGLLFIGLFLWKLQFLAKLDFSFGIVMYIFSIYSLSTGFSQLYIDKRKNSGKLLFVFAVLVVVFGKVSFLPRNYFLLIASIMFIICFGPPIFKICMGGGLLSVNVAYIVGGIYPEITWNISRYKWVSIVLIMFSINLILYYLLTEDKEGIYTRFLLKRNLVWILSFMNYLHLALYSSNMDTLKKYYGVNTIVKKYFATNIDAFLMDIDITKVGMCGMLLTLIWAVRGYFIMAVNRKDEELNSKSLEEEYGYDSRNR